MGIKCIYIKWLGTTEDTDLRNPSAAMTELELNDVFYKNLGLGAEGSRGIMGAGANPMNIYTVNKATLGLCDFLKSQKKLPCVAIAFDSRMESEQFARLAAGVIVAGGGKAYIFSELMPAPVLSHAVTALQCDVGIVITASHNPAEYNGYKVYGSDGCRVTLEMAEEIQKRIKEVDIFDGVKKVLSENSVQKGAVHFISGDLLAKYLDRVEQFSSNPEILKNPDLKAPYIIVNDTGNKPVGETLSGAGLKSLAAVPGQEKTEELSAFKMAVGRADEITADLLPAKGPNCDRLGMAVENGREYMRLSENVSESLPLNYILSQRNTKNRLTQSPAIIKTVVTSAVANMFAEEYGAQVADTSAGVKYIGGQAGLLEQKQKQDNYVFGFEESDEYLPEIFVRDKDAVSESLLICEMAEFYKKYKTTLSEELEDLYKKYGFWKHKLLSFSFEGIDGIKKIEAIMNNFRKGWFADYDGLSGIKTDDYVHSVTANRVTPKKNSQFLSKSDVLLFSLEKNCEIVIRPLGTEPKLKCYLTVRSKDKYGSVQMLKALETDLTCKINLL